MLDIQNKEDSREIPVEKGGVKGVKYPVSVLDKSKKVQNTTATVNLFVNLPHNFKGTHMSRFIEVFHKYHNDISMKNFLEMLEEIRQRLAAERAFGRICFPYYIEKKAPVTNAPGMMEYICAYEGESSSKKDNEQKFFISIKVPVATLCPCSKAISDFGAHNQRGFVKVTVLYKDFFWIEDIINIVETCASTPLYSILKRQDEKYVTEHAYENPRFVEDVVRDVYLGLKAQGFDWFSVEAETEESIHNHNAYAYTEFGNLNNQV